MHPISTVKCILHHCYMHVFDQGKIIPYHIVNLSEALRLFNWILVSRRWIECHASTCQAPSKLRHWEVICARKLQSGIRILTLKGKDEHSLVCGCLVVTVKHEA
eukprot:scaffold542544_cov47-Attheya_sp.AAC.1